MKISHYPPSWVGSFSIVKFQAVDQCTNHRKGCHLIWEFWVFWMQFYPSFAFRCILHLCVKSAMLKSHSYSSCFLLLLLVILPDIKVKSTAFSISGRQSHIRKTSYSKELIMHPIFPVISVSATHIRPTSFCGIFKGVHSVSRCDSDWLH